MAEAENENGQVASDVDPQLRIRFVAGAVCAKQYRQVANDVDP
jgi:hypothetical protein